MDGGVISVVLVVCDTLLAYEVAVVENTYIHLLDVLLPGRSKPLRTTDACEDGWMPSMITDGTPKRIVCPVHACV